MVTRVGSRVPKNSERRIHENGNLLLVADELNSNDVIAACDWVLAAASTVETERWDAPGIDGGWSPKQTLDHLNDVMLLYCTYVAMRARDRVVPIRNGDPGATPDDLVRMLRSTSAIVARLLDGMGDDERAFHPSGLADRTGWVGMACTELLVHGNDLTSTGPSGPNDLANRVVDRVLPWTPLEGDGWVRLLWATGRAPLGDLPPDSADWWWHSAPLSEWDGRPHRRDTPPQW